MSYRLFLLPSSNYINKEHSEGTIPLNELPTQIVSLINEKPESTVIITKTKPSIIVQFQKAKVFEKNLFGEPNESIIRYITDKQPRPRLVVLDRCFYEINGHLFNKILELQKKQCFFLVNITSIQTALDLPDSIKMTEAKQIDFPMCCVQKAIHFFHNHTSKFSFYEPPDEPIKPPDEPIKPPDEPIIPPVVNVEKEDAKEEEINRIAKELAKKQLEEFELKQKTKPHKYLKHCYVDPEEKNKPCYLKHCYVDPEEKNKPCYLKHCYVDPEEKNKPCYLKHCYVETEELPVVNTGLNEDFQKMDENNKAEFHFYKLLSESLQSFVDMELFYGFLAGIIKEKSEQNPDYSKEPECLPLLNLDFITRNFFNRKKLPNIEILTPEMKHKYIYHIQPEIKSMLRNAPELLERIRSFFIA